ncbi:hypothetical protein C5E02_10720 [Rathayibacter rathayi]|uniref:YcaO domain-containing protein n=1 Tax=Rathayibacter rathayi TaxID=33887 RepID=A0ABD6W5R2_RATRA|nr:YcaO-like family protein [Rathayibacter rathayi]AZZ49647.1 hypothetical protein C1O28_11015 [Rathayibacter rathayi]MWV75769.1 hypothetical protein [Rathayibacter rathayi NCPPB 2980 = VKM Ac-1601]PPF11013.1 hypothetical protein C5C04_12625 [Rathayibacter rathayi]PPF44599.1 hypothetical protein C5C08_13125 [Rathayibacter rathayi]PPF77308.1 hypothetical protein C5C14_12680 [Rathayibacter rathayi]
MLSAMRTLAPSAGLAERYTFFAPRDDFPLWQAVVSLKPAIENGTAADPESLPLVGATDVSRRRALLRATGEAVERWALRPAVSARRDRNAGPCLDWMKYGLANGVLRGETLIGENRSTGASVAVPVELIDYDQSTTRLALGAQGAYEPSPSGAAAGETCDHAVAAGVLELLERDALMVAWARQLRIERIEPSTLGDVSLAGLSSLVERIGLEVVVGDLGCDVDGVEAVIAICLDRSAELGSVGSKASTSLVGAVVGAIQESLQALRLGRAMRLGTGGSRPATDRLPRTEMDRARYWAEPAAFAYLDGWAQSFQPSGSSDPPARRSCVSALESTIRCGFEPLVVDLSARLPVEVRDAGWKAVKVLCPGLQPLRLDESLPFSWLQSRIMSAEHRTGFTSPLASGEVFHVPHPLV